MRGLGLKGRSVVKSVELSMFSQGFVSFFIAFVCGLLGFSRGLGCRALDFRVRG